MVAGAPRGWPRHFGEGWAFLPLGALLVDFALTIAVSCAAASSALIAYAPELADARPVLAVGPAGDAQFGTFQAATALRLLAAAGSSYVAGSGLLEALARDVGLLPGRFAATNRFHAPPWGIAAIGTAAGLLVVVAGGRDQELVQFYAVAVFASFLGALTAAARLAWRDGHRTAFAVDAIGIALIAFVLALNLRRTDATIALGAAALLSLALWRRWVAHGRPAGVAQAAR